MNALTYPDADHSAAAMPAIAMIPAPARLPVIDSIGSLNVSTADAGPSAGSRR